LSTEIEISVVSPVYQASASISELLSRLKKVLDPLQVPYEIVLVDDRSLDGSWKVLVDLAKQNKEVKAYRLSRNFGQHKAITAGLSLSCGKWVVVMDCDLQDRPEEIPRLYLKATEGYEMVLARRINRRDKWLKKASSKLFFSTFGYLTNTIQDPSVGNFGIYHINVIESILNMGDEVRYFPTLTQWVGFHRGYLDVQHDARTQGESAYNWRSLLHLAFDTILAFSDKPLKLTVKLGFWISMFSLGLGVYYLSLYFLGEIDVLGFASLIISVSFFSGIIILILGIIGLYVGKVFEKVKGRPTFIISESVNQKDG